MKKIVLFILIILNLYSFAYAEDMEEYQKLYEKTELCDFELVNNLDPYQVEDYYKYAWAPYPLFRTCIDLYFKNIHITPGYYLLTHRNIKNRDYVFFKSNGKVAYIVPVVESSITPESFYEKKIPKRKMNNFEKIYTFTRKNFYRIFRKGKKTEPPQAFIEAITLDNIFFTINLYYGKHKYTMIFKKVPDLIE